MKYCPPWEEPYIIGIAGYSGSGKTSISQQIISQINQPWTVLLSFDNFYNPLNEEESRQAFANNFDFDTPKSMDFDLLVSTVKALKQGKRVSIPVYSFTTHNRTSRTIDIYGANVIIIEGIYALHDQRLLDMMDLKVFVDTDLDVCLARRLTRDILYRGRQLEGSLDQWERFVKPNAKFVGVTAGNADVVIPRGLANTIAIDLMIKHITSQLTAKSMLHLEHLKALGEDVEIKQENLRVLPQKNQVVGLNSFILAEVTSRDDFIFYLNRMTRLLVEEASSTFFEDAYQPREVTTPYNHTVSGMQHTKQLMVVSIIPSGDCFAESIKSAFRDVPIGKVLIQSDSTTGEPQLHYQSIPHISNPTKVMLMDAQIISGAAAIMAIQILLDHKIEQRDIVVVTYLCTELGLRRIFNVFPEVKVVVGLLQKVGEESRYSTERFIEQKYFGST